MSLGDGEEAETLAEDILSEMREDTLYIIGPGGTAYRIKEKLHSKGTVPGRGSGQRRTDPVQGRG